MQLADNIYQLRYGAFTDVLREGRKKDETTGK
jgi:hypothetical protein